MKTNLKLAKKNTTAAVEFKIEKGIPIPSRKKPNPYHDLFKSMKNGDSFLVGKNEDSINRMYYQATRWGRDNQATFAFRMTDEGQRVWRIK